MKKSTKVLVLGAAFTGLMAGTTALQAASTSTGATPGVRSVSSSTLFATAKHSCKGKNSCKGQGGCKSGDNGCKGKNSCKGKGGCATDGSMPK